MEEKHDYQLTCALHHLEVTTYNHYAAQLQDRLDKSFKLAQNKLKLSQKRQYDKKAWGSQFEIGDRVWLFNPSTPRTLSW